MVFDDIKNIKYTKYDKDKVSRKINFDKDIAEDLNKMIKVYNHFNKKLKIDSSDICNIVLRDYFDKQSTKETHEVLKILTQKTLKINDFI